MALGDYRHVVTCQAVTSAPDGDGGTVETWADLTPPTWHVAITPATVRDLEKESAGTIVATSTHIVTGPYRGDVHVDGRLIFQGRELRITGIRNLDERGITMQLFAKETV